MLLLAARDISKVFVPIGAIIVAVVIAGVVIMFMRRRLLAQDLASSHQGRLLDDLRGMRERGEISEQEFNAARSTMAARLAGKPVPPTTPRPVAQEQRARPGYDLTGAPLPKQPPSPGNESQ